MKILYAIQGTGNGHISRAREFIPHLKSRCDLDLMLSGTSADVQLGYPVKYNFTGISYTFGKNGGIDYLDTARKLRPIQFLEDISSLPVENYDVIISDFEPVSAWAAKLAGVPCIGLSHQASFLSDKTPRPPGGNAAAEIIFRKYAPCTHPVGIHYKQYDDFIWTPIIRSEIRKLKPVKKHHITVYLPAYTDNRLIPHFKHFPSINWHIFSKHANNSYTDENIQVFKVNNDQFLNSLESSLAVISGGGFEAPAESLFLGKKILIVPMKDQYEQKCNAQALAEMGVPVAHTIDAEFTNKIAAWLDTDQEIDIDFPDLAETMTEYILDEIVPAMAGAGI